MDNAPLTERKGKGGGREGGLQITASHHMEGRGINWFIVYDHEIVPPLVRLDRYFNRLMSAYRFPWSSRIHGQPLRGLPQAGLGKVFT